MRHLALLLPLVCIAAADPKAVILQFDFDGEKPAGELETVKKDLPEGSRGGAGRAIARKDGKGKLIRLQVDPHKAVGMQTVLRFRYHIKGADRLTVQMFDVNVQDNRHIAMRELKQGQWTDAQLDFTKDSRRNDGTRDNLPAGNKIDDLFFFVDGANVELLIDDVVLFDGAEK